MPQDSPSNAIAEARLLSVQVGTPRPLDPEGQMSAIRKHPVAGTVRVGIEGLEGDAQGDRRVHGGPEKAVHQYAFRHYAAWAQRFPVAAPEFIRGSFGENLSTDEHDETNVHIGDHYGIGSVILQVCQPRRPCWKLDHRFDLAGLAQAVQETGRSGWYFRVLQTGLLRAGDTMRLLHRPEGSMSLAEFWRIYHADRPDPEALAALRALSGLAEGWVQKIGDRLAGLSATDDVARLRGSDQSAIRS